MYVYVLYTKIFYEFFTFHFQICSWVQENGGWASVLRSGLNVMQQTAMIGACAAVFVCCVIYIRKNWWNWFHEKKTNYRFIKKTKKISEIIFHKKKKNLKICNPPPSATCKLFLKEKYELWLKIKWFNQNFTYLICIMWYRI